MTFKAVTVILYLLNPAGGIEQVAVFDNGQGMEACQVSADRATASSGAAFGGFTPPIFVCVPIPFGWPG